MMHRADGWREGVCHSCNISLPGSLTLSLACLLSSLLVASLVASLAHLGPGCFANGSHRVVVHEICDALAVDTDDHVAGADDAHALGVAIWGGTGRGGVGWGQSATKAKQRGGKKVMCGESRREGTTDRIGCNGERGGGGRGGMEKGR